MTADTVAMLPIWYWTVTGALLGVVIASFCAVVIERVPARRSLTGRSTCACGRPLRPWENVPLVGWLAAGGRARCCGVDIPVWYVLLELAFSASWAIAGTVAGPRGLAFAALVSGLLVVREAVVRRRRTAPAGT